MQRKINIIHVLAVVCVILFSGQQYRTASKVPQTRVPKAESQRIEPPRPEPVRPEPVRPEPAQAKSSSEFPILFLGPEDVRFPQQQQGDRSTAPRTAVLLGNPRAEGLYVTRTLIPRGKQIVPHIHSDSRTVVVLSGTYYYGIGEEFDAAKLVALPPGSFMTEPAGVPHFTWAKDGEVIVQTTAIGPSGTRLIPDKPQAAAAP